MRRTLAKCKSYRQTTEMLAAVGTIFKKRCGASVGMGRAVRQKSADGTAMPDPVTPDMMVQGSGLSIVVEIKAGFPSGARARQKIFEQLKKYDWRLAGWPERDVDVHDIMVVTRLQSAVEMSDYMEGVAGAKGGAFSNPLCVVEFARLVEGREEAFFVRIRSGSLANAGLYSSMRRGIEISTASIMFGFSTLWFYDSEPDPPYTISILWERIFPRIAGRVAWGLEAVPLRTTRHDS